MLQNETKSPQCVFPVKEKHRQRDQAKELNGLYPTLTPAPSSPCGPQVTLVGDTLSRAVKWIQRGCRTTAWRDGAPWQWGKSRYENKLTAWRIDGGTTKTKQPSCFQETFRPLKPTGKPPGGLKHKAINLENLYFVLCSSKHLLRPREVSHLSKGDTTPMSALYTSI